MSQTRISGLISGMDTESIISQLVATKQTKVTSAKNTQTKLSWKQDIWKDLNKELKSLQTKLSNLRFSSSYQKKTTAVSDSTKASVIASDGATNTVQSLEIKQVAKSGYLTGAQLSDDKNYTALSTLKDLGWKGSGAGTISITTEGKTVDFSVNENTSISDVLTQLKDSGLNASFDATNQRIFVSSSATGKASDFSITASDSNGLAALNAMGLTTSLSEETDKATYDRYQTYASYVVKDGEGKLDKTATLANMQSLIDKDISAKTESYLATYKKMVAQQEEAQKTIDELSAKGLKTVSEYDDDLKTANQTVSDLQAELDAMSESDSGYEDKKAALETAQKNVEVIGTSRDEASKLENAQKSLTEASTKLDEIGEYISISTSTDDDGNTVYSASAKEKLVSETENSFLDKATFAATALTNTGSGATKVSGQDAIINLNGAEFKNNTNVFSVNGLTITALSQTAPGESVTLTTQDDTDGIYDMIKDVIKQYNTVVNRLDSLYNADSAKGYEPLSDEEKEAMSEAEAEKYEKKIKDSLLRGDSTISSISNALQSIVSTSYSVNGKSMYLSDFGISTLSYFTSADNEKHALHIDGDADDESTSGNEDKIKSMIAANPGNVINFFTQLSQSLYSKMSDLSSSQANSRTYGSFYNDIKMKSEYSSYTTKISNLEEKLNDYEDKLYSQYSSMETALAKLQSKTSALSGLLGS